MQGHIDVLEDLTGRDAEDAFGRFDQIVALASALLTAERVDEGEAGGELPGFDQKAGAIGDPWIGCFHERVSSVLGSRFSVLSFWFSVFGFWFLVFSFLMMCCCQSSVGDFLLRPRLVRVISLGLNFLVEGESECTSERALGQFSIFGAVEENGCHGFSEIGTDQEACQRCGCKPRGGLGFGLRSSVGRKNPESREADCTQGLHRKCRKGRAVLSSWFSVLGSQFLVLSSWFSVLSSWFSVLIPPRFARRDGRGGRPHMVLADDCKI